MQILKRIHTALVPSKFGRNYKQIKLSGQLFLSILQEMYAVAQTYEVGSAEYKEVFETAVRLFPEDEVANLNAANAAMARKDYVSASRYLEKAGNDPRAVYARGILAGLQSDYQLAISYLQQAKAGGVSQADEALAQMEELTK